MKEAPEWILVGRVKRIHGGRGEMLIQPSTDRPGERLRAGADLFLRRKRREERLPVKVLTSRTSDRGPLIRLEGIDGRERAEELFGADLFIRRSQLFQPGEGSYYAFQLEGCEVWSGERRVGVVTRLIESRRANPYLEVEPGSDEKPVYVPFVSQVVAGVDLKRQRIEITPGFLAAAEE